MKINFFVAVALSLSVAFTACDDTTDTIGNSLTDTSDLLDVATATFDVSSSSFTVDSVFGQNSRPGERKLYYGRLHGAVRYA